MFLIIDLLQTIFENLLTGTSFQKEGSKKRRLYFWGALVFGLLILSILIYGLIKY